MIDLTCNGSSKTSRDGTAGLYRATSIDHLLLLLVIDGLSELLSHAGEVADGDLVGGVVIEHQVVRLRWIYFCHM